MKEITILCVDSTRQVFIRLQRILGTRHIHLYWESRLDRLIEWLESRDINILLVTGDAMEKDPDALDLISLVARRSPGTVIVSLVNNTQLSTAIGIIKAGGYQYTKTPIGDKELKFFLESALEKISFVPQNHFLKSSIKKEGFGKLIGVSSAMKQVYDQINQAAMTDAPVLITGETGTGKDLVAQAIHQMGQRRPYPFVPIHLGTLPADLVPSELFGHEKGAFTGATIKRPSIFEQAEKGTVFLDEIATTDEKVQVSLLRLIESREFFRIGSNTKLNTDVRILAATNVDLEKAVRIGQFREDLYYRLNVLCIHLPPLRDRTGDIPILTRHFTERYARDLDKTIRDMDESCLRFLESYDWPGNVRDLKNLILRAVVQCEGDTLLPDHFPKRLKPAEHSAATLTFKIGTPLADVEKEMIRKTLLYTGNNKKKAADILGISRRTLYNRLGAT